MGGSILLSKDRGINARLTCCIRCGKDCKELLLVGVHDYICFCPTCSQKFLGSSVGKCPTCKKYGTVERRLDEYEKVPNGLCDECIKLQNEEQEMFKQEVSKGGVYFKCKCGVTGVLKSNTEIAKATRKASKIEVPNPVGISFDTCPSCTPTEEGV